METKNQKTTEQLLKEIKQLKLINRIMIAYVLLSVVIMIYNYYL